MTNEQQAILVESGKRLAFRRSSQNRFEEKELQDLISAHPAILPIGDIESGWEHAVSLGTEIASGGGPMDVLLINAQGRITIVETKLFRNPEAKRKVLAQVINYAASLHGTSYEAFTTSVLRANPGFTPVPGVDPLVALCRESGLDIDDESRFHDRVQDGLDLGRFLLLIVGEGIRSNLQVMTEFVRSGSSMAFSLGLIELQHFHDCSSDIERDLWVPRILGRLQPDLERVWLPPDPTHPAIQELVAEAKIDAPPSRSNNANRAGRTKLGGAEARAHFWTTFEADVSESGYSLLRSLVNGVAPYDFDVDFRESGKGLIFRSTDPTVDYSFNFLGIDAAGRMYSTSFLQWQLPYNGLPSEIAKLHFDAIGLLLGDCEYASKPSPKDPNRRKLVDADGQEPMLVDLLESGMDAEAVTQKLIDIFLETAKQISDAANS